MDSRRTKSILFLAACLAVCAFELAQAGQGCPFDHASCQDYCSQQGCNYGYCGHFAWIQCICRKCGDEWGYHDKVHYDPNKEVNQTELDSLKLDGRVPLLVSTNSGQQTRQQQQSPQHKHATLTTLLIPDLSDASKLDLNDVPDENSEKFLDFLAKNHEKLVRATSQQAASGDRSVEQVVTIDLLEEPSKASPGAAATTVSPQADEPTTEEMVEIQISSSNNNTNVSNKRESGDEEDTQEGASGGGPEDQGSSSVGSVTRLLRMAVAERSSEEIERRR